MHRTRVPAAAFLRKSRGFRDCNEPAILHAPVRGKKFQAPSRHLFTTAKKQSATKQQCRRRALSLRHDCNAGLADSSYDSRRASQPLRCSRDERERFEASPRLSELRSHYNVQ
jgi:hypothetical protein